MKCVRRVAVRVERDLDLHFARTGAERAANRGRAILGHRADHRPEARDLERRIEAWQHREDVRAGHRERRRAEIEERMAERVDARAVDVGDGAGRAHLEIAANQADADRIAGLER